MRDVASGDFIGWLDQRLRDADDVASTRRGQQLRMPCDPLLSVHGRIAQSFEHDACESLLAAGPSASGGRWLGAMVAIDSLVHGWLWRSGILER